MTTQLDWIKIRSAIRSRLRGMLPDIQLADLDDITQEACCLCCDIYDDIADARLDDPLGRAIWRACRAVLSRDDDGDPVYSLARVHTVRLGWESSPDYTRSLSGASDYSRAAAAGRAIHPVATDSPADSPADDWDSLQAVCLPDVFSILSDRP